MNLTYFVVFRYNLSGPGGGGAGGGATMGMGGAGGGAMPPGTGNPSTNLTAQTTSKILLLAPHRLGDGSCCI